MSIGLKRMSFLILLVIGLLEVFLFKNGAVISIGTVFGAFCIYGILYLLKINIFMKERSFYIKDLSFGDKILAVVTFVVSAVWFVSVALHF